MPPKRKSSKTKGKDVDQEEEEVVAAPVEADVVVHDSPSDPDDEEVAYILPEETTRRCGEGRNEAATQEGQEREAACIFNPLKTSPEYTRAGVYGKYVL